MPYHKMLDAIREEGVQKIGTTGGHRTSYIDSIRTGIRVVDLLDREVLCRKLKENIGQTNELLKKVYDRQELDVDKIIAEYRNSTGRSMPT